MIKAHRFCAIGCAVAILATSLFTGCNNAANGSTTGKSSGKQAWDTSKKDTVVISVINNYYTAGEKKLAQDYMKLHPETKVTVDVVASNDAYLTKLKTTMTTDINTAPDIVHANFAQNVAGSWSASYAKNYIMDMTPLLDQTNPYNDNKKVRDVFDASEITRTVSSAEGKVGFLPFDYCGIGFFYNKTVFDKYGLKTPTSFEDLVKSLATLKSKGFANPVVATPEAEWLEVMIADVVYRDQIMNFLTLPGDAAYDATTMENNTKVKYSATDPTFDLNTVLNDEKIKAFEKKNNVVNDKNIFVWTKFAELAKYFQPNFAASAATDDLTQFEAQKSAVMATGSWECGSLVKDLGELSSDKRFQWGSFTLPNITDNNGYTAKMRSLYVFGNCMGIIPKNNPDHEARVEDIMKYWYSPKVAQMMYDVTLSSGNLVQGPPAIKGVKLSAENAQRLNGFVSEGTICGSLGSVIGASYLDDDKPAYQADLNDLCNGTLTPTAFMNKLSPLFNKKLDSDITKAGYDLNPATKDTPQQ